MKRLILSALAGAFLLLSQQQAKAPVGVFLGLALKCTAIGTIGTTAYIICKCEPAYYLVKVETEDELYWLASQASAATVKKNEGWRRCRGPFKDRKEPEFQAWCNNKTPNFPMFGCSAIGGPMPGPIWTNYMRVTLEQSTDGGSSWAGVASTVTAVGDDGKDDGWSFVGLPASGTNGFSLAQLNEVAGASAVFTNTSPAAIFRTSFEESPAP